jgi:hypothetical protein
MKFNASIPSALGIVFIILKLINKIDWSWWWVLSPFWIPMALFIIIFIFLLFVKFMSR